MKKLLPLAMLLFASFGVFAAETIDDFDTLATALKTRLEERGVLVRADKAARTIFLDFKVPNPSNGITQAQIDAMKPDMIRGMKERDKDGKQARLFKDLKVTLVYNFVTTDGVKYTLVISYKEL